MPLEDRAVEVLQALGLNHLEAEVYTLLLQEAQPVTAYRVGKVLGRPTANVYKAIDALARKGAVIVDEGSTRLCRPVPPREFLGQLRKGLLETTKRATEVLSSLGPVPPDAGIYHLQSAQLVLERCRAMLRRCKKIAVVDAFPGALQAVLPAIRRATDRGVDTYIQIYEPCYIPDSHIVLIQHSKKILQHWKSQQLNVVVDAEEVLLALLHPDLARVYQAIWTRSLYLSCTLHMGLLREHTFQAISAQKHRPDFPADLRQLIDEHPFFHATDIPGQKKLFARFGISPESLLRKGDRR